MRNLKGKRIAILATDGFEEIELVEPRERLSQAGAVVEVVSLEPGSIRGWKFTDWGRRVEVDKTMDATSVDAYDALVLPGGLINPDRLRAIPQAVALVRAFVESGKPVAAICHGPWLLVEAGVLRGRRATSYPSIRTDLENAGAKWIDEPVVVDGNLITSRRPKDLTAFVDKLAELVARAEG
jgi:protease I